MYALFRSIGFARVGLIGFLLSLAAVAPSTALAQVGPPIRPITIIQPTNGAVYAAPATVQLLAKVGDQTGGMTNVSFYSGTTRIGKGQPVVLDPPGVGGVTGLVYLFDWTNVPAGNYSLTAVATGPAGLLSYTSNPVGITVTGKGGGIPVVRITSPPNRTVFFQPSNIPVFAFAADIFSSTISTNTNGYIANVEFYAGTNDLGAGQHVVVHPPDPLLPIEIVLPNEFTLTWAHPPAGQLALTAVATDGAGNTATSAPVNITIVPSQIVTYGADIVSIVASDPIAVTGTNCWVWPGLPVATPLWSGWKPGSAVMYTNCGPNDATFTVRRAGNASNDLSVFYSISGTASNGVDYAELPGVVTIPAGENYAYINIIPVNDAVPAFIKTVVLTLQPSESAGPAPTYTIGVPRSAAAIIVDSIRPRPVTGPLPGPVFHVNASGPDGAWFSIQSSTDMLNWTTVATSQIVNGSVDFVDPSATAGQCFYRTVQVTAPPLQ